MQGFFVGFAENIGHDFTFRVLTADTHKIICRSRVRIAADGINKNVEAVLNTNKPDPEPPPSAQNVPDQTLAETTSPEFYVPGVMNVSPEVLTTMCNLLCLLNLFC